MNTDEKHHLQIQGKHGYWTYLNNILLLNKFSLKFYFTHSLSVNGQKNKNEADNNITLRVVLIYLLKKVQY